MNKPRLIELHKGDCVQVMRGLPDKSIDCVVTSPPYFNLRDYGVSGQIGQEKNVDEYILNLVDVFSEVYRILKDDGGCFVNIDDVYIKQSLACIPDKFKNKTGFSFPSVDDWNAIKWIVDDWSETFKEIDFKLTEVTVETDDILKNSQNGRIKRAVWSINTKPFKGYHYAPFPEELVRIPILACTPEGGTVLDPFMGSGTTGLVAKKLKRKFVGIELNAEYIEIARERISVNG